MLLDIQQRKRERKTLTHTQKKQVVYVCGCFKSFKKIDETIKHYLHHLLTLSTLGNNNNKSYREMIQRNYILFVIDIDFFWLLWRLFVRIESILLTLC